MKFHPIFKRKQSEIIMFDKGFKIPMFTKETTFADTSHSSYRRRRRHIYNPLGFKVPIRIYNKNNQLSIEEVMRRVNDFFYSEGPERFKIPDTSYYFIGEFDGPIEIDFNMNVINYVEVTFNSEYPYKFYDDEQVLTVQKTVKVKSKTQLPTTPLIEFSGLSGNNLQLSVSGDKFMRFRMSGNLPANISVDFENEKFYETNSGVDLTNLVHYDSAFSDFKIDDGDTLVLTNDSDTAKAVLTYKELLL